MEHRVQTFVQLLVNSPEVGQLFNDCFHWIWGRILWHQPRSQGLSSSRPLEFPVVSVLRKRNGNFNYRVSVKFPNYGNSLFHPKIPVDVGYLKIVRRVEDHSFVKLQSLRCDIALSSFIRQRGDLFDGFEGLSGRCRRNYI